MPQVRIQAIHLSQQKTLDLLREYGKPARPLELARLAVKKGILSPEADNNPGKITHDLKGLAKWGIVRVKHRGKAAYWEIVP